MDALVHRYPHNHNKLNLGANHKKYRKKNTKKVNIKQIETKHYKQCNLQQQKLVNKITTTTTYK